jgi:hypothetical protein
MQSAVAITNAAIVAGESVTQPVRGLSLCIPVLNESGGIAETLRRCLACEGPLLAAGLEAFEVIVVDDGSTDDTADQVRRFPVRLLQHEANRGYGAALKTGFAAARYDLIGFLDADATYPPEHFPALCQPVLEGSADLAIGSRMSGAASSMPATRRLGNWFFANLLTVLGRATVRDAASGMRVFRKRTLEVLLPLPDGLNLTPVMSTRAVHEDVRVVEVPIPYEEREGRSKLNVVKDGFRFLETIVWTTLTYNPVRIIGLIGVAAVASALLVALALTALRLQGVTSLGPAGVFAVFAATVAGAAGVSLFALGVSFNYLVSLFYQRTIRQGLFRRPIFRVPIERYFLPMGLLAGASGVTVAVVSVALATRGWPIERLWLYLTGSALLVIVGIQLGISWLQLSILRELSSRATASKVVS